MLGRPRRTAILRRTTVMLSALSIGPVALAVMAGPAVAQTSTTTATSSTTVAPGATTSTTLPPAVITITPELPSGGSAATLPLGKQVTVINITNTTERMVANEQVVIRAGLKPDTITNVRNLDGIVGVVDIVNGSWFHTVAQITPAGTAAFVVTWNKVCPGRYPVAVRLGDVTASKTFVWTGPAAAGVTCPVDETVPASYFALPWPPTFNATSTTLATPATSSTAPISTTTLPSVTSTSTAPTGPSTTAGPSAANSSTTTSVPPTTTTRTVPTTIATPTTRRVVPTTMLVCRTVKAKRVCSAAKPTPTKPPRRPAKAKSTLKRTTTTKPNPTTSNTNSSAGTNSSSTKKAP